MLLLMVVALTWDLPLHPKEAFGVSWNATLCFGLTEDNKACKLELSKNE